jgi:MFS family permease
MLRNRSLALVVLCAGALMVILDQTIVNVALPSIRADLGLSQRGLSWVVNGYLIPFGVVLLPAGRLGDLIGRRRVFRLGLAVFTAASLLCGLATTGPALVAARVLQGAGGGLGSAVVLGMIVAAYPDPRGRARAIGAFSFVGAAGASIGLILGGVLTQAVNWHWIFLVNLPVGVAAALLAGRVLPTDPPANRPDRAGRALAPVRLVRATGAANVVQALLIAGMMGFQFMFALYLQRALGYRPAAVGAAFLPVAGLIGALSLGWSPRLISRFGARPVLTGGLAVIVAGLALLARVPAHAAFGTDLLPVLLLLGFGGGLTLPAVTTLAMSGVDDADAGLASGLVNTTQQVGGVLGVALLASLDGYRPAFGTAAGLVLAALVATVALRPGGSPRIPSAASRPRREERLTEGGVDDGDDVRDRRQRLARPVLPAVGGGAAGPVAGDRRRDPGR